MVGKKEEGLSDCVSACGYNELQIISSDCDNDVIRIDNCNYKDLINNMAVLINKRYDLCDRLIIEGYTNKLNNYIVVDGVKTNIQIAVCDGCVIVGSPLINDSF